MNNSILLIFLWLLWITKSNHEHLFKFYCSLVSFLNFTVSPFIDQTFNSIFNQLVPVHKSYSNPMFAVNSKFISMEIINSDVSVTHSAPSHSFCTQIIIYCNHG